MSSLVAPYQDWKAPAHDGGVLLWPDADSFCTDVRDNARHLQGAGTTQLQGIGLPEVRRATRRWAGLDEMRPLIVTGHQTELYHAGVWAKEALLAAAAERLGGQACHVAVDTDGPKHLSIRWPGANFPITDDPRLLDAEWSGQLACASPAHLKQVIAALRSARRDWIFEPVAGEFLSSLLKLSPHAPELSPAIAQAMRDLDRSLGFDNHWLLVSPLLSSEPYLLFAHHLLARAPQVASQYNQALADFRSEHKIRSVTRPMPDLAQSADTCEAPFWLDDLNTGGRSRASVHVRAGRTQLRLGEDVFEFDVDLDGWEASRRLLAFFRSRHLRLSPRALTLTMFLRLCLADQFVHGIGGGKYDQVTDSLIAQHFGLLPPKFAVTTATLYFPAAGERERACLPCLAHKGHQLKHRLLGKEKMAMVSRIDQLPRNSAERQIAFGRMQGRLAAIQLDHPVIREWEERFRNAREQSIQDQIVFDRELFYGIQSRERLVGLSQRYRTMLGIK